MATRFMHHNPVKRGLVSLPGSKGCLRDNSFRSLDPRLRGGDSVGERTNYPGCHSRVGGNPRVVKPSPRGGEPVLNEAEEWPAAQALSSAGGRALGEAGWRTAERRGFDTTMIADLRSAPWTVMLGRYTPAVEPVLL